MKFSSVLGLCSGLLLAACDGITVGTGPLDDQEPEPEVVDESVVAGANQNDRSTALQGEDLRTGAMVVSPDGRHIVMQRNVRTVLYDANSARFHELPIVLQRVAFAESGGLVFGVGVDGRLHAIDLVTLLTRWSVTLPAAGSASMLKISDDGSSLLLGQASALHVIDASTGAVRNSTPLPTPVTYAAFVPGAARALVVGQTVWRDGGPHTPIYGVSLQGSAAGAVATEVPNCEAPIEITNDGARAFLSPTYCSPGAQAVPGQTWTNPDPVSVIDLAADQATFLKNLPGFGPVSLAEDGSRLVAYLDTARMDPAMFDDPEQVPWSEGERYHLMTIDPVSLRFELTRIGNAIPRFAMTRDGRGLLVDASAKASSRVKIAARAEISIGADGIEAEAEANVDVFGSASAFGYFDLDSQRFTSFAGPKAPLDRFVQLADGRHVLTLATRADGGGGTPYMIDLTTHTTTLVQGDFGRGVRDVGLSADGTLALLRVRLAASEHDGGYYGREGLCVSSNGSCNVNGGLTASYEESVPFAMVPPPPPPPPPTPQNPDPVPPPPDPRTTCPQVDPHEC